MKRALLTLVLSIMTCHADGLPIELQIKITPAEFEERNLEAIPKPESILEGLMKKDEKLATLYKRFKEKADDASIDEDSSILTPVNLVTRTQNEGFDHSFGKTFFHDTRIVALYVRFHSRHAHGAQSDKGFFVVYEINCIHANDDGGKTSDVEAKVILREFSESLDMRKIPSVEQVWKSDEAKLEAFKKSLNPAPKPDEGKPRPPDR